MIDIQSEDIMIMGRRYHFSPRLQRSIIGRRGSTHGARIVSIPDTNASIAKIIQIQ